MQPIENIYESFDEGPWPLVRHMMVDVVYIGPDTPEEWLHKTFVSIAELRELSRGIPICISTIIPNFYDDEKYLTVDIFNDDSFEPLVNFRVLKLYCRAGLIFKNTFDITQFFFENYNPMLMDEYDRMWRAPYPMD